MLCVQVNSNGALQWGTTDQKLIAPYYGDTDMSSGGSVFYRSTSNSSLIQQVSNTITASFAGATGLALDSLFVATWHHVPAIGQLASMVSGENTLWWWYYFF